jgi:L-ascorbate metabolism protein UlaG (beta-lactamase superfamily)
MARWPEEIALAGDITMQVVHLGQSCVLVDIGAARLLLDPGVYSTGFDELTGLDAILVTHQHPDHLDIDRVARLARRQPDGGAFSASNWLARACR